LSKRGKKRKKEQKAIPLGNLGFASCRLLNSSAEAARIMTADILIFQKTCHGKDLSLTLSWKIQRRKFVKQANAEYLW
jgi:hypothetical protein